MSDFIGNTEMYIYLDSKASNLFVCYKTEAINFVASVFIIEFS